MTPVKSLFILYDMANVQVSFSIDEALAKRLQNETESVSGYVASCVRNRLESVERALATLRANHISVAERRELAKELKLEPFIRALPRRLDTLGFDVCEAVRIVSEEEEAGRTIKGELQ